MISFRANCIATSTINKYNSQNEKESLPVSFVQLNLDDKNDKKALKSLAKTWIGNIYAHKISKDFQKQNDSKQKENPLYFYGLTLQQDGFEKIDPSQVLGITEISNFIEPDYLKLGFYSYDDVEINYIQTNPQCQYPCYKSGIKDIGKKMIACLREHFAKSNLWVIPSTDATKFYEKLGFEICQGTIFEMVLKKALK